MKSTLDESDATINSTISNAANIAAVKWQWITLPVTVVLLSVIFLVITILVSRRQKLLALWKSTVIPLLYHGLDGRVAIPDGIMRPLVGWRRMRSRWRCDWRSRSVGVDVSIALTSRNDGILLLKNVYIIMSNQDRNSEAIFAQIILIVNTEYHLINTLNRTAHCQ